jgi:hypothetical protein
MSRFDFLRITKSVGLLFLETAVNVFSNNK